MAKQYENASIQVVASVIQHLSKVINQIYNMSSSLIDSAMHGQDTLGDLNLAKTGVKRHNYHQVKICVNALTRQ